MNHVVIIPARDEQATISNVVQAAVAARVGPVLVVDDGSRDETARRALRAGAYMIRTTGVGKGRAMLAGCHWAGPFDAAVFLDGDLVGLRARHVATLSRLVQAYDHVVQLRDYGPLNGAARALPLISGERAASARLLRSVPERWWTGFYIEQAINRTAQAVGAAEIAVIGRGVSHRVKARKRGLVRGVLANVKMFRDIAAARLSPLVREGDTFPRFGERPVYFGGSTWE